MKKSDHTKKKILAASEELFMKKSISKVTVNEITEKAGVAKGTFYLYFDSKETLVWQYLEERLVNLNHIIKNLELYGFSEENIRKVIAHIVSCAKKHKVILRLMHHVKFFTFLGSKRMQDKHVNKWIEWTTIWLEKGKLEGNLSLNDSKFTAYFLVLSVHEVLEKVLLSELPFSFEEAENHLQDIVLKILK